MAGLRETKKEATRSALADAAATLALTQGGDAVTVSAIAGAAGVSPRTFHNYFTSAADALLWFTAQVLEEFITQLPSLHVDATDIVELFELIVLDSLDNEDAQLRSVPSLYRIGEALENLNTSREEKEKYFDVAYGVLNAFHTRFPTYDAFHLAIQLQACSGAAIVALKECSEPKLTEGDYTPGELVHRAFSAWRSISGQSSD